MSATDKTAASDRLWFPALGQVYSGLHDLAETLLRVIAGGLLVAHGWPKIQAPLGLTEMIAAQGIPLAGLLSVLVSLIEFFGGLLLLLGLFTRPAALAATVVLLTTVWFHWVAFQQGFQGAEFSILWAAVAVYFVIRGGNAQSLDARLARTI